jgi:hypothetical protein
MYSPPLLQQLTILFQKTCKLVYDTLDARAFWLYRNRSSKRESWDWLRRPTTVVYDPLMFVFSHHLGQAQEIVRRKKLFQERITSFYSSNSASFEGRYTNISNVVDRNQLFEGFVTEVLGI